MSNFFEKLKKGMEIKDLPASEEKIEEKSKTENEKEKKPEEKPSFPREENLNEPAEPKAVQTQEPTTEKPSIVFASTSFAEKLKKPAKRTKPTSKKKKIKVQKSPLAKPKKEKESFASKISEGSGWFGSEGELTVDIYQTNKEIVIQSAIAGVGPEDLDISIEKDMVVIKGNREKLYEKGERNYVHQECYWGQFSREIILPEEVDNSRTQASIKQGVLTIRLPKIEREEKRKIVVR